jgi:hypothetical protein
MSDPGVTLEIHYWTDAEGQPVVSNVQYGRQANCYTNTEQE